MIDETDISQEKKLYYKERAETIIDNFKKRHINGLYAATGSEALAAAMSMIPPGAVVAHGDSISVEQIGLSDELTKRGQNKVINFLKRNILNGGNIIGEL